MTNKSSIETPIVRVNVRILKKGLPRQPIRAIFPLTNTPESDY